MNRHGLFGRVACLALLLAACTPAPGDPAGTDEAADLEHVDCALAGAPAYQPACTVERSEAGLVVRHPDGGFRRFVFGAGDNRIRPADGAEAVRWRDSTDGRVELVIGQDRYLLRLEAEATDDPSAPASTGLPGE